MPLNPAYETKTLLEAFEQGPLVETFLRDTFFKDREYPPSPTIEFDFRRGRRKMAPFVAPLVGGKLMERQGFETRFFRAPRIAPVRALRTPDLEPRLIGENIYSGRTPADRAAELLADDSVYLDEAISRREEWMCRQLLVNGQITVTADTNYQVVINFKESSAGTADNHEPVTTKWDQAGSDPLADLERGRRNTIKVSGIAPNVALFGVNAAEVFIRNDMVKTLLDSTRYMIAGIEPIIQSDSVVRFGRVPGLELYSISEYFEDDAGTIFPMIPDNFVMLLSTNTPNKIVYGAFTQLEDAKAQRFQTYQTDRVPFIYGDEEGGSLFYRLTSCPLPMPADILGWRIIEALTLTFPAELQRQVEGDAVLDALTGEITGGKDEAAALKKEAAERAAAAAKGEKVPTGDLDDHTVDELKAIADREGADISGVSLKADIIKAIKKNRKDKEKQA